MSIDLGLKLTENANVLSEKPAVIFRDKATSYKELNEKAVRVANAMNALGLKPKDKVSVILRNCTEYVEIICGLIKARLVHVPINWRLNANELRHIINNSDSVAVILGQEFIDNVESIRDELVNIPNENYILVSSDSLSKMVNYQEFVSGASSSELGIENGEFDPYFFGYTSGSTGTPKGAITRHGNWEIKVAGLAGLFGRLEPNNVQLLTMPLFHMNAINTLGTSLYLGQTVVVMPRFDAEDALRLIQNYKCTWSSMVPTMYHRIKNLSDEQKTKYDISSMKSMLQSSAPLNFETKKWVVEFFKDAGLYEGYGGTEAGAVAFMFPDEQLKKPGSVGRQVPTAEVKIVDESGNELKQGQVGQIISKQLTPDGPMPAVTEYYKDPDATSNNFIDGWFYSGDMGYFDKDGYLYLVDRVKDMIISGGENIWPQEIEDVLQSHPGVEDVAVIGVPDEEWGESVKAVVTLKKGEVVKEEELIEFCKSYIGKFKTPKSIDFTDELPKTETGKILRRIVKEKYWKDKEKKI